MSLVPGDTGGVAKAWSGRFSEPMDALVEEFTVSLPYDKRLFTQDIECSRAHARMLAFVGLITAQDADKIETELEAIQAQLEVDTFPFAPGDEDIHMAIERVLTERTGSAGARLHTARSRNDQVVTDLRLWLKEELSAIDDAIRVLQDVLVQRAEEHIEGDAPTIMPGYTHLQRAQPVLLSHHLLAYFWMLERDRGRIADCLKRNDVMPLGSAALAGTTLPIDRLFTAAELGFGHISDNSLDAVSDRDFVVEALSALSLIMVHLSRMAEEIVLWTCSEFNFAVLPDSYATGSSMMPQKKNPDVAELVRGKTGRIFGHLMAMLTTLKGLPLSYNRDLQEDKEGLFDAVDTVQLALSVWAGMMVGIDFNRDALADASADEALFATDLMEYLVRKGVPLREAHHAVGRLVRYGFENDLALSGIPFEVYTDTNSEFGQDIYELFSAASTIKAKISSGGTGTVSVLEQLEKAKAILDAL